MVFIEQTIRTAITGPSNRIQAMSTTGKYYDGKTIRLEVMGII